MAKVWAAGAVATALTYFAGYSAGKIDGMCYMRAVVGMPSTKTATSICTGHFHNPL